MTVPKATSSRDPIAARPLRVVIVDEELPYPLNSGKRIRTLNLTRRLAQRHEVTYLCHRNADPVEAAEAQQFLGDHGVDVILVDRPVPPRSGLRFFLRLGLNLLSSLPYSVASHNSRDMRQAIRKLATTRPVDLWHCEWTPYAEPLRVLPDACKLVMAHNVESLIWQRYHETESNPLKRWYIKRQWRKFEEFERRVLREADCTVAVSPEDAVLFQREFAVDNVAVVDNGVDTEFFQPSFEPRHPHRILFLGSLDWRPNLDAVSQIFDRLLPTVRRECPDAVFTLVGRKPPSWLRERAAATPGIELHADVADVRPFLTQSAVMVVPLRIGGGSRLKILEALAAGLPVVSTRVGAEGLHLEHGEHLVVRETVDELADALLTELRHPAVAQERADRGRQVVLSRYDWNSLAERLEQVWLDCVARRNNRRKEAA